MKTITLTRSALAVAFISISAQITISLGIVPFTLQVFALSLLAYHLSTQEISLALLTYITLGLIGLPIFAQMKGGLMMLTQPSFGFIIGFIPFTLLLRNKPIIAYLLLYTCGLAFLIIILKAVYQSSQAIPYLIFQYGLLFMPTDILAITLAHRISKKNHFKSKAATY